MHPFPSKQEPDGRLWKRKAEVESFERRRRRRKRKSTIQLKGEQKRTNKKILERVGGEIFSNQFDLTLSTGKNAMTGFTRPTIYVGNVVKLVRSSPKTN